MNKQEALHEMIKGKKITCKRWGEDVYCYFDEDKQCFLYCHGGDTQDLHKNTLDDKNDTLEIY